MRGNKRRDYNSYQNSSSSWNIIVQNKDTSCLSAYLISSLLALALPVHTPLALCKQQMHLSERLQAQNKLSLVNRIQIELFGSLAFTGKGHGTDNAILLGLEGKCTRHCSTRHYPQASSRNY